MPNRMLFPGLLLFWASCFAAGCLKPEIHPLEFFAVETGASAFYSLDSFQATGVVSGLKQTTVDSCGFIWSEDIAALSGAQPAGATVVAGQAVGNGNFQAMLPARRGAILYFRAFAFQGERQVFGQAIRSFALGSIVELAGKASRENNSATVPAILKDLNGITVEAHGHVYSATNPMPEIAPGCDCDTVNLGQGNDDGLFLSRIDSLDFNTTYHVRAYVIYKGKPYYSDTTSFRIDDGWERIGDFPRTYQEGLALADEKRGKAFAGFGCQIESGCTYDQLPAECWDFDPAALSGTGAWVPTSDVAASVLLRTNASGFIIQDTLFLLFGEQIFQGNTFLTVNFKKFDLHTKTWLPDPPPPPPDMKIRTRAVAFSLNKKGYAGCGLHIDGNNNPEWLSDFWEYDPATGSWRTVAGLPAGGREEAAVFPFANSAVVGGGLRGVEYRTDFWKFTPPADTFDLGSWTPVKAFPGPGRTQAIAFAKGTFGYFGTGINADTNIGLLDDWWEYNSDTDSWISRTRFPGARRRNALGFSLGKNGYLFAGVGRLILNNGGNVTDEILADGWRYIPPTK